MAAGRSSRRTEDQASDEEGDARTDNQEFDLDLRKRSGNERRPDYPSYNAGYTEKHEECEYQLERAVPDKLAKRYRFRDVGWIYGVIHNLAHGWTRMPATQHLASLVALLCRRPVSPTAPLH